MRVCTNCHYHKRIKIHNRESWHWQDTCDVLASRYNPVTGEGLMGIIDCMDMRLGPCGLDGDFFVKKDKLELI